jgi:hypothetical protein
VAEPDWLTAVGGACNRDPLGNSPDSCMLRGQPVAVWCWNLTAGVTRLLAPALGGGGGGRQTWVRRGFTRLHAHAAAEVRLG